MKKIFLKPDALRPTSKTELELEPCMHEEIKVAKQVDEKDKLKCHFCGDSKARTEAGMNKVKYRLKHPGAGFWSTLLGRNWKYACHDCTSYMMHLWGPIKVEVIDKSVPIECQTYYCRTEQHQMCGGFECKCDCHEHTEPAKCVQFVNLGTFHGFYLLSGTNSTLQSGKKWVWKKPKEEDVRRKNV